MSVREDTVGSTVLQDGFGYAMLEQLRAYAGEGNRAIICSIGLV